jgi:hypothetical protein
MYNSALMFSETSQVSSRFAYCFAYMYSHYSIAITVTSVRLQQFCSSQNFVSSTTDVVAIVHALALT